MKNLTSIFLLFAFLSIIFSNCKSENKEVLLNDDVATAIDSLVTATMQEKQIPGLTLAVLKGDSLLIKKSYGLAVVEHNVPAKIETKYALASITKQFVAMGILLLVQDGLINLDAPIKEYLIDIPDKWKKLTLRQLLSHTAGLAPQENEYKSLRKNYWPRIVTREMMFESALEDSVYCQLGECFRYHNTGYFLADLIIEKITGKNYQHFFQERIFDPLEMTNTYFEDQLKVVSDQAQGYSIKDGELVKIWRVSIEEMAGGWGIFSCIDDMIKWKRALDHHILLTPEVQGQMFEKVKLNNGSQFRYGLGWYLPERNGISYQYHNGITGPEILKIPSKNISIIVLSNFGQNKYDEAEPWGLADLIASHFYPEFKYDPKPIDISEEALKKYVGKFQFNYGEAEFLINSGQLFIKDKYGEDPLIHIGNATFCLPNYPLNIHFMDEGIVIMKEETWEDDFGVRVN